VCHHTPSRVVDTKGRKAVLPLLLFLCQADARAHSTQLYAVAARASRSFCFIDGVRRVVKLVYFFHCAIKVNKLRV
jgi:hypothetical protein